ncbi:hypothetical protein LTR28_000379, partial [Elasticomyces elasticus]
YASTSKDDSITDAQQTYTQRRPFGSAENKNEIANRTKVANSRSAEADEEEEKDDVRVQLGDHAKYR